MGTMMTTRSDQRATAVSLAIDYYDRLRTQLEDGSSVTAKTRPSISRLLRTADIIDSYIFDGDLPKDGTDQ